MFALSKAIMEAKYPVSLNYYNIYYHLNSKRYIRVRGIRVFIKVLSEVSIK